MRSQKWPQGEAVSKRTDMATAHSAVSRKLYGLERKFTAVMIIVMGIAVFLDVMHRFWTHKDGLFAGWFAALGPSGANIASQLFGAALTTLLTFGALRTRGRDSSAKTWLLGAGLTAALWLVMEVFVRVLPNGLVWSQTLGLALMLSLATLGASLATYEHRHLALDLGSKLWPKRALPYAQAVGNLITALFCLTLAVLSVMSIRSHFGDWVDTDHAGGTFAALPIPKWLAFIPMPIGFGVMAMRFFGQTLDSFRGAVEEDDPLQMLGLKKDGDT